ncbi:unnamed protein product [Schistosoma curassoni]|uniref:Uncharacterized protein n=1 Tax=Schistosoma curassoni TaxID=6186 RepID=A0A183JFB4_9TREM|nr:unnamed protein product [Schistosoma curassoni]
MFSPLSNLLSSNDLHHHHHHYIGGKMQFHQYCLAVYKSSRMHHVSWN